MVSEEEDICEDFPWLTDCFNDDDYYSETYCECETTDDEKEICKGYYCDDYKEEE